MGHRITWRGRPRSGYPWPLRTEVTDEAALIADHGTKGITACIGPLPLQAMMELIYRVKSLSFEMSVETKYAEDYVDGDGVPVTFPWVTTTRSGTLEVDSGTTETDVFEEASYGPESSGFVSSVPLQWYDGYEWGTFEPLASSPLAGDTADIYTDGSGNYWASGGFNFRIEEYGSGDAVGIEFYPPTLSPAYEVFDVTLILNSGTYTFPWVAACDGFDIRNSEITFTATEWWPYKTTAGSPAWDTATGDAINGGPGA